MLLYDLYETAFGIFDHQNITTAMRPLATVAMHQCEDINDNNTLEQTIRTYVRKNIKDYFGYNLEEFLNLPMDLAEMLIGIANEEQALKGNIVNDIEKSLKNSI